MDQEILLAFKKYKRATKLHEIEKQIFLLSLPEEVQTEFNWNGLRGIEDRFGEYYDMLKEFVDA
jgi:hypothetical protein